MYSKILLFGFFSLMQLFHRGLPVQKKRILFFSDVSDELKGNLKCVYEALNGEEWTKVAICQNKQRYSLDADFISRLSKELNSAQYILLEDVMPFLEFYRPKKGQEIIQLWHAAGAFKKFGFSRDEDGLRVSKGHRKYTKAITSSEGVNCYYADAYGIPPERVVATGIPRTDMFFDNVWCSSVKQRFLERYPSAKRKKVILFAPTYRGTKKNDAGYDMTQLPIDMLEKELSDDYIIVIKWHPAMYNHLGENLISSFDKPEFIIDLSDIQDVNEIIPAADILITDYSSLIFEWSLLERPIIYYVYDLNEYENTRGLYEAFDNYVYGSVVRNADELIHAIRLTESKGIDSRRCKFVKKYMNRCDGGATERVVRMIK